MKLDYMIVRYNLCTAGMREREWMREEDEIAWMREGGEIAWMREGDERDKFIVCCTISVICSSQT